MNMLAKMASPMQRAPGFERRRWGFWHKKKIISIPEGMRVYAVGDIHGCAKLLDRLTAIIVQDSQAASVQRQIVYLGDYVDRGPDSKGVIERLLAPPPEGFLVQHLRGNHDQMMLDFLTDPAVFSIWKSFGAQETLMSYGVLPPRFDDVAAFEEARDRLAEALPQAHLQFLQALPLSVTIGGYFFAHAGVHPGIALHDQVPEDLLWIRDEFLNSTQDFGTVIVHGHSPTEEPVRRPNRIGVDTGAYATGRLTCVVLQGTSSRFLHT